MYTMPLISTDMLMLLPPLEPVRLAAGSWRLSEAVGKKPVRWPHVRGQRPPQPPELLRAMCSPRATNTTAFVRHKQEGRARPGWPSPAVAGGSRRRSPRAPTTSSAHVRVRASLGWPTRPLLCPGPVGTGSAPSDPAAVCGHSTRARPRGRGRRTARPRPALQLSGTVSEYFPQVVGHSSGSECPGSHRQLWKESRLDRPLVP